MFHHCDQLRVFKLHLDHFRQSFGIRVPIEPNQPFEFLEVILDIIRVSQKVIVLTRSGNVQ